MRPRCLKILKFAAILYCIGVSTSQLPGQDIQGLSTKTETVHGQVLNRVTHEPVVRALVFSPDSRFASLTDSEGRFEFTFPTSSAAGSQSDENRPNLLLARKPGFLENDTRANLPTVIAGKSLTIWLTPEALIVGRALFPVSDVSDRIQVEIYRRFVQEGRARWTSTGSVRTNSSGEFRFAELGAGSYKLLTHELLDRDPLTFDPRGQLHGYPPVYFPNAGDLASASTIQLSAGETFQADIPLGSRPYYRVKVAVVNPPPGANMDVTVSAQGHRGPGYSLGYNGDDHTIEGLLPDGTYAVEASSYERNVGARGMLNLAVKGGPVEGPRITLVPNGTVRVNVKEEFTSSEGPGTTTWEVNGRIVTPKGPRRYLDVLLEPAEDFAEQRTLSFGPPTGRQGDSLVIDSVPPGRYWVRVNSSRGFASSVTSGVIDLRQQSLVVGAGGLTSPIEITMRDDWAEIDGTVESAAGAGSGAPAGESPSAYVYCVPLPDSKGEFRQVWLSPDGSFNLQQLPPGDYRVLAFDRPQSDLEYRNPEAMRTFDSQGQVIHLVAGQKEHLRLQLISTSE